MKNATKIFFISLSLTSCFLLLTSEKKAQETMHSQTFEIDAPNINIGGGNTESANFNLSTTIGQAAAGKFASDGFVVRAGFQYLHSIIPFTFSISDTSINLGILTPQTASTESTDLTVSFGSSGLYQVTAIENRPLTSTSGLSTIPNTRCNSGSTPCSNTNARAWTQNSAYGFGYNMGGEDIPQDFIDGNRFRPFADNSKKETPAVLMTNQNVTLDPESNPKNTHRSAMTFKVNVSPLQPAGTYNTIIDFVAVPSY